MAEPLQLHTSPAMAEPLHESMLPSQTASSPFSPSSSSSTSKSGGALLAILGFILEALPFAWSIPEALITAELAAALPGNAGFVLWTHRAFGPFPGSLTGSWKFLSGVEGVGNLSCLQPGTVHTLNMFINIDKIKIMPAGVDHVGGDVFASIPNGDVIFMKWILHDWSDEHSIRILKNCLKALPKKGKVIVVDFILPETLETGDAAQCVYHADMTMMLESPSGKERTEEEFKRLAFLSGFSSFKVVCSFSGAFLMEFNK